MVIDHKRKEGSTIYFRNGLEWGMGMDWNGELKVLFSDFQRGTNLRAKPNYKILKIMVLTTCYQVSKFSNQRKCPEIIKCPKITTFCPKIVLKFNNLSFIVLIKKTHKEKYFSTRIYNFLFRKILSYWDKSSRSFANPKPRGPSTFSTEMRTPIIIRD
jgi:hypothetical protein